MNRARFRYALEPVRLQRLWAMEELQRDLAERNAALAKLHEAYEQVRAQLAHGAAEYAVLARGGAVLVDRFSRLSGYLADRHGEQMKLQHELTRLELERDEVIERLTAARRALDAVEEHKDKMRGQFVKESLGSEFKAADDQWSILQAGEEKRGY